MVLISIRDLVDPNYGRCVCFAGMCVPSRRQETALICPPISRSLHSNGSKRYNIFLLFEGRAD
jgi:hypothetical protein